METCRYCRKSLTNPCGRALDANRCPNAADGVEYKDRRYMGVFVTVDDTMADGSFKIVGKTTVTCTVK